MVNMTTIATANMIYCGEQMFIFFAYFSKAPENDTHLLQDK